MTKAPQKGKSLEKSEGQVLLYQTEEGQTKLEVQLEGETVYLTQKAMAKLYQTSVPNINIHIQNIYSEGELSENSVIKESLITAFDEATVKDSLTVQKVESSTVKRPQDFYSLDILSLEYRIKSHTATHFRQ